MLEDILQALLESPAVVQALMGLLVLLTVSLLGVVKKKAKKTDTVIDDFVVEIIERNFPVIKDYTDNEHLLVFLEMLEEEYDGADAKTNEEVKGKIERAKKEVVKK